MTTNHDDLVSQSDAERFLNVSNRHLRRLFAQGKLRREHEPRKAGQSSASALYYRADLEAIKRGEPNLYAPVAVFEQAVAFGAAVAKAPKAIAAPASQRGASGLAVLEKLLGALAVPVGPRFIPLEEAVAISGLSLTRIRALAPLWAKRGDAVRGARAKRADGSFESCSGWKIRRAALDAPLPTASA